MVVDGKPAARLRVCASCEWIFKLSQASCCPKCGFAHYGARYVYGNRAYRYEQTQEPWVDKKLQKYLGQLLDEVELLKKLSTPCDIIQKKEVRPNDKDHRHE